MVGAVNALPTATDYQVAKSIMATALNRWAKEITKRQAEGVITKARARMRLTLEEAAPNLVVSAYHKMLALYAKAEKADQFKVQAELLKLEIELASKLDVGKAENAEFHGVEFRVRLPDRKPDESGGGGADAGPAPQ